MVKTRAKAIMMEMQNQSDPQNQEEFRVRNEHIIFSQALNTFQNMIQIYDSKPIEKTNTPLGITNQVSQPIQGQSYGFF